ncbi:MAG: class I SAM-dependent methyltransferase [Spirochaetia bacterium]|nr:class I SAM-dependent methyltransferase [Spirochaetia bacterium]
MSIEILNEHRQLWNKKPSLRAIYSDYYRRIVNQCIKGRSLEIGGGTGNLKDYLGEVISTDIVLNSWLDAAVDAHSLPFKNESFGNIVGVDILHHIERPHRFLAEAERVLQPGGRIIFVEPAITPASWAFYNFAHPEPVDMSVNPLEDGSLDPNRKPFDSNQAIPSLLFAKYRKQTESAFPLLKLINLEYISFFVYPLSGGFRSWSLIPSFLISPVLRFENAIAPLVGKCMAFRLFVVIEKRAG